MVNAADFKVFTDKVRADLPDGREKAIVLTKLDEARLWAEEAVKKGASNG